VRSPPSSLAERLRLIVVTDSALAAERGVVEAVRAALAGGAPAVQLRDKAMPARELVELARTLREDTRRTGALLFVNDRLDVALAAGADGAHLGDDDLPLDAARAIAPPGFLLGRSAASAAEARTAFQNGADYIGVGAVFGTATKADAGAPIGIAAVAAVVRIAEGPVVGIGGIDGSNAGAVIEAGADGIAVVSAVMAARDPAEATRRVLAAIAAARSRHCA
jgi:thiamine-phosphate pyrophosphorylase